MLLFSVLRTPESKLFPYTTLFRSEIETKISILRDEFTHHHSYNPIEHVKSRVKSPDSIVEKVARRGVEPDFASIRQHITDRKSTRLNSSHSSISYAVSCLKKKRTP